MTSQTMLPTMLILVNFITAIVYATNKDWSHFGYWLCAAGITFFATFKI